MLTIEYAEEAIPKAMAVCSRTMEAHPGAAKAHPGDVKAHPETM